MGISKDFKLIVTIIAQDMADKVLDAIEKEGVKKSTVLLSRGISDNNPILPFNVRIDPRREVILTLVPKDKANRTFEVILEAGELEKPLNGLTFISDIEKVGGIDLSMFDN
ncbi:P-II family nitrogen regulator [Oceanobacillus halophilus]|uniref:P-II family nitrogen regulator n=1 Tax=Oceanobacillus halophilus TaxID=930130 RepID=A0A494ZU40_9BACI|nr:P-II family nitrogen regulator [Oceanobacillus halophilus]RKQ29289.1 P-II family nitrogen regulator [Oceanobacillus halophilus]